MASVPDWAIVAYGGLAAVFVVILGYFLLTRLRAKRQQLVSDLSTSPVFAEDRAHNQIRIGRAELAMLRRDGRDAPRAGELLDAAEAALTRHDNVQAVRFARDAHDLMLRTREASERTSVPVEPPSPSAPTSARIAADAEPAQPTETVAPPPDPARPPRNRMEAHFQMTLLVEQLSTLDATRPRPTGLSDAEALRAQAEAAYAQGDYTESLRLALRGRRRLGAQLETLPPPKSGAASPSPVGPDGPATAPGPAAPSSSTATEKCRRCGRPVRADDRFCRGCGASRAPAGCPRCSAPIGADDTFCGRCGSPLA